MDTGQHSNVTVRLVVDELDSHIVEIHDAPNIAVTLTAGGADPFVYLVGTPDELHWLCDKLRAIVTAHESSTKLASEAAMEAVAQAECEHPVRIGREAGHLVCGDCGKVLKRVPASSAIRATGASS